jgi:hypothetical protein
MAENVGRRGDSWFFRIDLPPGPDGKRRVLRASSFGTEREARRALAQAKVDIDAGRLRHGPQRAVADLAAESSRRVLHLDRRTADVHRDHRDAMVAEAEQREEFARPEYFFVDEFGDPFHPARLTRPPLPSAASRSAGNHPS